MRQHPELGRAHHARVDKRTPRSRRLCTGCVTWPRRLPSSSSPWPPWDKAASVTRSKRNGDTSTPDDEGNVVSPRSSERLHCRLGCPPLTICMNRTPTQTACTDAHSVSQHILNRMITFHHANTRGSRLHIFVSQNSGHPRVMSRSLPHLTLTDHKHKFSLTCLTYLSDVLSLTPKSFDARSIFTLRRSTAGWRINTNPVSHNFATSTFLEHASGRVCSNLNATAVLHAHFSPDSRRWIAAR